MVVVCAHRENLLNVNFQSCFVTAATVRHCAYHYIEVVVPNVHVSRWVFKTSLLGKLVKTKKTIETEPVGRRLNTFRVYEALITI